MEVFLDNVWFVCFFVFLIKWLPLWLNHELPRLVLCVFNQELPPLMVCVCNEIHMCCWYEYCLYKQVLYLHLMKLVDPIHHHFAWWGFCIYIFWEEWAPFIVTLFGGGRWTLILYGWCWFGCVHHLVVYEAKNLNFHDYLLKNVKVLRRNSMGKSNVICCEINRP